VQLFFIMCALHRCNDDWEYTGTGDLDKCNGMSVDGQYGYYVTDTYPCLLYRRQGQVP